MRVLTISAHPDDETLGCGGALLRHRAAGDSIFWLIVTQPYEPTWTAKTVERKALEVERVSEAYGVEKHFKLGFPTVRLDTYPQEELIGRIGEVVSEVGPEVVYVVHGGDVHTDHQVVFTSTMSVLKPFHLRRLAVRRVLCYESLSSTEAAPPAPDRAFIPQVFCDISSHIDRKIEILGMYETELQPDPMPRSASAVRALARYRGASISVEYAEAFMLIREVT